MVKYRPHRGALCDAMAEMRIFDSVEDMFHYIVEDWKAYGNPSDMPVSYTHLTLPTT